MFGLNTFSLLKGNLILLFLFLFQLFFLGYGSIDIGADHKLCVTILGSPTVEKMR